MGSPTSTQPIDFALAEGLLTKLDGQDLLLVALMLYTGRRFSDVCRMRWEDLRDGKIYLKERKTGKYATVTINPRLQSILDRFSGSGYILHPAKFPGKQLSIQGANHRLKTIAERHGIEAPKVSTHMLRKTFSRRVFELHGITILSHMLNHDSEKTTRRYIGLTDEAVSDVYLTL